MVIRITWGKLRAGAWAEYERYRTAVKQDEAALAAWRFVADTRCVVSFERSFMRPMFE